MSITYAQINSKAANRSVITSRNDPVISGDDGTHRCLSTVTAGSLVDGHGQEVFAWLWSIVLRHEMVPASRVEMIKRFA
jgi:hypothetical protein